MFSKLLTLTLLIAFMCSCTLGQRKVPRGLATIQPTQVAPVAAKQTTVLEDFALVTTPRKVAVAK